MWSPPALRLAPIDLLVAVAIQEALEEAGIGVPFPQRDLHLVSVSPNAAAGLGRETSPSLPPGRTSASDGES